MRYTPVRFFYPAGESGPAGWTWVYHGQAAIGLIRAESTAFMASSVCEPAELFTFPYDQFKRIDVARWLLERALEPLRHGRPA